MTELVFLEKEQIKQHLTTKRLELRPMHESDFDAYLCYATDPDVMRFIRPIGSIEQIRKGFKGFSQAWDGTEGRWMALSVLLNDTGTLIGDVGFRYQNHEHQQIEIGYKFHRDYHGKGYGTEAVNALVQLILEQWPFHKLVAYCDPRNEASFGVMRKLGMVKEAYFKEHYKYGDSWQDELAYGVLRKNITVSQDE